MQKELLQKVQVANIGEHIGVDAGEEMVKRFFDKHPDQEYVNVMGREIIEKILAQPDCKGIAIAPGYDLEGNRHVVLMGVNAMGHPIYKYNTIDVNGQLKLEDAIVANRDVKQDVETIAWD